MLNLFEINYFYIIYITSEQIKYCYLYIFDIKYLESRLMSLIVETAFIWYMMYAIMLI